VDSDNSLYGKEKEITKTKFLTIIIRYLEFLIPPTDKNSFNYLFPKREIFIFAQKIIK